MTLFSTGTADAPRRRGGRPARGRRHRRPRGPRPDASSRSTSTAIVAAAERTGRVITVEEHSVIGGLGGAVAEALVGAPPDARQPDRPPGPLPGVGPERRPARDLRPLGARGWRTRCARILGAPDREPAPWLAAGRGQRVSPLGRQGRSRLAGRRRRARPPSRRPGGPWPRRSAGAAPATTCSASRVRSARRMDGWRSAVQWASDPGREQRDVGPRVRLQRPPDALEGHVARQGEQPRVEPRVGHGHLVAIAGRGGPLHRIAQGLELGEVGVRHARHAEPRTERLELGPHGVGLEQLGGAGPPDARSPERGDLDEAERFETAQGLAHRRLARAERRGRRGSRRSASRAGRRRRGCPGGGGP